MKKWGVNMRKVVILTSRLTESEAGRGASELSKILPEQYYEKYLVLDDAKEIEYSYRGDLIDLKMKVSVNFLEKALRYIKKVYQVKRIKKGYKIDTAISFSTGSNIINIITKKRDKAIIVVQKLPQGGVRGLQEELAHLFTKLFYQDADTIVVPLQEIKQELIEKFNLEENKIKVIYNSCAVEKIKKQMWEELEVEYRVLFTYPVIINVGRLSSQKGQWPLIKAFKKVKDEMPSAKLLLLGEGEMEDHLKQLVTDLELEGEVHFLGMPVNPYKFMARANVCVFPSLYEDYPHELCEAMACGVPVIATDCSGGPREILAPETKFKEKTEEIELASCGILVPVCGAGISNYIEGLTEEEVLLSKSIIKAIKQREDLLHKQVEQAKERVQELGREKIMRLWAEEFRNMSTEV